VSVFLGSHDRISGLFLLNPGEAQNRHSLAKILNRWRSWAMKFFREGDPVRLTTLAWAFDEAVQFCWGTAPVFSIIRV
jgi:hypothetical protein